jgi:putative ABC transport system permease protein
MVSIARKNLFEDIPRFLVAQAGIMLAVTLVTIQTGVLKGFSLSTGLLIDQSQADIWVGSKDMVHLELTKPILYQQYIQAKQIEGVQIAEPLLLGPGFWTSKNGELTPLKLFGFNPEGKLFVPGKILVGQIKSLKQPLSIIADQSSLDSLKLDKINDVGQLRNLPAKLVAITKDTQSIAASTFVFTSLENANTYVNLGLTSKVNCTVENNDFKCTTTFENKKDQKQNSPKETPKIEALTATDPITYILIKAKPGQNIEQLKQRLEKTLPNTKAYTTEEMAQKTRDYWTKRTGVGFILGMGATVGVVVGMVVVGQILYTSVSDHLKEFGTLKAMGASNGVIYGVILEQAVWMAILGYIPGMLLCLGLSHWALQTQGIMILITPITAGGVLVLTVLMCTGSALFAIQKVTRVDPAIVFKA